MIATSSLIALLFFSIAGAAPLDQQVIELDVKVAGQKHQTAEEELAEILAKIKRGDLPKIQFQFDSDKLLATSQPALDAIADLLMRTPRKKLLITAHTCIIGTPDYNLDLSKRRAKAVKTYLTKKGVPPPSVRFRGKGSSQPIGDNKTRLGRSQNRRVEFILLDRTWSSVY